VGARKLQVHQGDVGPMTTKFSNGLHGSRPLRNKKHILLRADDCSQSLAEDWMILYAQDTNRLGLTHYDAPTSAIVMVCFSSDQSLDLKLRTQAAERRLQDCYPVLIPCLDFAGSRKVRHLRRHARTNDGRLARVIDHVADHTVLTQRYGNDV